MNPIPLVPCACSLATRQYFCALCLFAWTHAAMALQPAHDGLTALAPPAFTLQAQTYPGNGGPGLSKPAATMEYTAITGWLTPRQASSLGLTLAVVSEDAGAGQRPMAYELGVRWRAQLNPRAQINVHSWTRTAQPAAMHDAMGMIWQQEQSRYGTRLEVQWTSSRTHGLVPEFGAIGVQMEGNSRLLLRARRGGPMLYYRTKF